MTIKSFINYINHYPRYLLVNSFIFELLLEVTKFKIFRPCASREPRAKNCQGVPWEKFQLMEFGRLHAVWNSLQVQTACSLFCLFLIFLLFFLILKIFFKLLKKLCVMWWVHNKYFYLNFKLQFCWLKNK